MRKLSQRQDAILSFIDVYVDEHGYPPSIREIGAAVGDQLDLRRRLQPADPRARGLLRRDREVSRGLGLIRASERQSGRPGWYASRWSGGSPLASRSRRSRASTRRSSSRRVVISEDCYALQVKGKSMIEDLIDDGDSSSSGPRRRPRTARSSWRCSRVKVGSGGRDAQAVLPRARADQAPARQCQHAADLRPSGRADAAGQGSRAVPGSSKTPGLGARPAPKAAPLRTCRASRPTRSCDL